MKASRHTRARSSGCNIKTDACAPETSMFTCVGDGDVGGPMVPAEAAARSRLSGPQLVVFIVHTLPGVQSKHGRHCQVPRPGQEANLFICQLLAQ